MYIQDYNVTGMYGIFKTDNVVAQNILEAYSEAHSRLWQMFYGWREADSNNVMTYYVPHRDFQKIRLLIEDVM